MNRNLEIKVRFTRDELQTLDKKVKKTGMSREGYVRTLCKGKTPVELPTADYHALIREVRALGETMNQIAYKAHAIESPEAESYRQNADHVIAVADKLTAVCLPK